jgi:hypothetical protein
MHGGHAACTAAAQGSGGMRQFGGSLQPPRSSTGYAQEAAGSGRNGGGCTRRVGATRTRQGGACTGPSGGRQAGDASHGPHQGHGCKDRSRKHAYHKRVGEGATATEVVGAVRGGESSKAGHLAAFVDAAAQTQAWLLEHGGPTRNSAFALAAVRSSSAIKASRVKVRAYS